MELQELRLWIDADLSYAALKQAIMLLNEHDDRPEILLVSPEDFLDNIPWALVNFDVQLAKYFTDKYAWALLGSKYAVFSAGA